MRLSGPERDEAEACATWPSGQACLEGGGPGCRSDPTMGRRRGCMTEGMQYREHERKTKGTTAWCKRCGSPCLWEALSWCVWGELTNSGAGRMDLETTPRPREPGNFCAGRPSYLKEIGHTESSWFHSLRFRGTTRARRDERDVSKRRPERSILPFWIKVCTMSWCVHSGGLWRGAGLGVSFRRVNRLLLQVCHRPTSTPSKRPKVASGVVRIVHVHHKRLGRSSQVGLGRRRGRRSRPVEQVLEVRRGAS